MLAPPGSEVFEGDLTEGVGGVITGRAMTDAERRNGVAEQRHPMIEINPEDRK